MQNDSSIQNALLSVSNKEGLYELAKTLVSNNIQLVATRGTADFLRQHNFFVTDVEKITGYPPLIGVQGIKIIHPNIFSGVLADSTNKDHLMDLDKYGIPNFDMVVCNFYPFEKSISKKNVRHEEAIFNLDIGGPAIVRCAAKNYKKVTVLVDPNDYEQVSQQIENNLKVNLATRQRLSLKAFNYTFFYDKMIIDYLSSYFENNEKY
jgi:phosphoribosylaminoimidazolecarboxamide formyltransferase/IMP cyclohydrolase